MNGVNFGYISFVGSDLFGVAMTFCGTLCDYIFFNTISRKRIPLMRFIPIICVYTAVFSILKKFPYIAVSEFGLIT